MPKDITITEFKMTAYLHEVLCGWLKDRGMEIEEADCLPRLGLLASHCNRPVATAFLRMMEGNSAMIDGLICDPHYDPITRSQCIDELGDALIELAKHQEFKSIFALTLNQRMVERSKKMGFTPLKHKLLMLKIGGVSWVS